MRQSVFYHAFSRSLVGVGIADGEQRGMNKRRTSFEVMAEVLRLGQARKTEIMYRCNLSHRQLREYLAFLSSQGFIYEEKREELKGAYTVTLKGQKLLQDLEVVLRQLSRGG